MNMKRIIKKVLLEFKEFSEKEDKVLNYIINDIVARTRLYMSGEDGDFENEFGFLIRLHEILVKFLPYTWMGHEMNKPFYLSVLDNTDNYNKSVEEDWFQNLLNHQYGDKIGIDFTTELTSYVWNKVRHKLKDKFKQELTKDQYERYLD